VLAVVGLLALAAQRLARSRRRTRRRRLLAIPNDGPEAQAVEELRERPRPVPADEAARILGVEAETLTALKIPATPGPDGGVVYDSWEIVHWVERRRSDPAAFAALVGGP
jgi:hypothetical protein